MQTDNLKQLLESVRSGETSPDDALLRLRDLPYEDLGFAKLDHHRALRNGFPEVIYCTGKETGQIVTIAERLAARSHKVLATRATPETAAWLRACSRERRASWLSRRARSRGSCGRTFLLPPCLGSHAQDHFPSFAAFFGSSCPAAA